MLTFHLHSFWKLCVHKSILCSISCPRASAWDFLTPFSLSFVHWKRFFPFIQSVHLTRKATEEPLFPPQPHESARMWESIRKEEVQTNEWVSHAADRQIRTTGHFNQRRLNRLIGLPVQSLIIANYQLVYIISDLLPSLVTLFSII